MDSKEFREAALQFLDTTKEILDQVNTANDFDVEDPLFFAVVRNDEGAVEFVPIKALNEGGVEKFPPPLRLALFKELVQKFKDSEESQILAAAILAGGWKKTPEGERVGEVITLNIEDPDRNTAFFTWKLERPEAEDEPCKLTLENNTITEDDDFASHGRMQNFYDAPARTPEDGLN